MSTPEWLRPITERYLAGEVGPPPAGARLATLLAAVNALAAGGMVLIWAPISRAAITSEVTPLIQATVPVLLALAGVALLAVLAPAVVMIIRRGWCRAPATAGWVLGGLALFGLCVAAQPSRIGADTAPAWEAAGSALPWLIGTAASAFGMSLLLRTGAVSNWLARRRHQIRTGRGGLSAGASG